MTSVHSPLPDRSRRAAEVGRGCSGRRSGLFIQVSTPALGATRNCWASTSPMPGSTSSIGCSSITPFRNCRSRVAYKERFRATEARAVWIGDVLIRHAAVGTDTYELNRNLILTDGARADSVPNLEIDRRGRRCGTRQRDRALRRRAVALSPVAWHSRGRGPSLRCPRFLRRHRRPDRRTRAAERLVAAVEHELEQAARLRERLSAAPVRSPTSPRGRRCGASSTAKLSRSCTPKGVLRHPRRVQPCRGPRRG